MKHQHIEFLYTLGQDTPENIIDEMRRELHLKDPKLLNSLLS